MGAKTVVLQNDVCAATFDTMGGALVGFNLKPSGINPLSFCWQENLKGKTKVLFKGHFLCLGRWGDPSALEAAKGHVKHGDFNQLEWQAEANGMRASLSAQSHLEGLQINRKVELDASEAVLLVNESVQNTNSVSRLYNMVQHPTLGTPFLNAATIVDCNATVGFDYAFEQYNDTNFCHWPEVHTCDGTKINLVKPERAYSSVFSFVVNPADEWGWITASSPGSGTLIGYLWKRAHYPWLAHWLHFEKGQLQYRGLEFGTTGVHKSMKEIWDRDLLQLLGEKTCCFIDTGETQHRAYISFLLSVPQGFKGVQHISLDGNAISITEKETKGKTKVFHHLNIDHAFQ